MIDVDAVNELYEMSTKAAGHPFVVGLFWTSACCCRLSNSPSA